MSFADLVLVVLMAGGLMWLALHAMEAIGRLTGLNRWLDGKLGRLLNDQRRGLVRRHIRWMARRRPS